MTIGRYERLSADLAQMQAAGPIRQAQLLPRYLDSDVGKRGARGTSSRASAATGELWLGPRRHRDRLPDPLPLLRLPHLSHFRWRNGQLPHRKMAFGQRI